MANKNLFNSIQLKKPKKNAFDLTHDVKLSLNMGDLVPIMCLECVPGDQFKISCESLLRFAPLIAPVMHRMDVTMHYFFVPNRLLWENWEEFITGGTSGILDAHAFPTVTYEHNEYFKLLDYFGIPMGSGDLGATFTVNALPLAAYQMIYQEYYRDQNLVGNVNFEVVDGDNSANTDLRQIRKRAWMHDYFTSALPWAQRGQPVSIPVGQGIVEWQAGGNPRWVDQTTGNPPSTENVLQAGIAGQTEVQGTPDQAVSYNPNGSLVVNDGGTTTINDLRRAFRLQEWLEKNARAGARYVENILAHFGVRSSDARLQRPEYITGVKSPVVISEILNTTGEDGGLPQGNMAGHGISVTTGNYGKYFCEEHGYIIGIMSVTPKTAYASGIPRHFLKGTDQFDFFYPEFAHLGEQPIYNAELFSQSPTPKGTFGYTPRYSEYKYMPSMVAGDFRTSLKYWHLGRFFDTTPALNQEFVECVPTQDIFAIVDESQDKLYCHVLNKVLAIRPMPKFGTPSF